MVDAAISGPLPSGIMTLERQEMPGMVIKHKNTTRVLIPRHIQMFGLYRDSVKLLQGSVPEM
jgi:hypothetical protein